MLTLAKKLKARSKQLDNGCIVWTGYVYDRYAYTRVDGKDQLVHRIAYEVHKGPIPSGATVDHLCFNRICINPDHLEAVTRSVNSYRYLEKFYKNNPLFPCGHPRTEANTYTGHHRHKSGAPKYPSRRCLPCTRNYNKLYLREWKRRKNAAANGIHPEQ